MKVSIWHLSFVLLAGLGLAGTLSTRAFGQVGVTVTSADEGCSGGTGGTSGLGSVVSAPPAQQPHSFGGPRVVPEGWYKPHSEEELRFRGFFMELRAWDEIAKCYSDKGDAGWADHMRSKLERESGLTASEADQVKQIMYQYFQDLETNDQKSRAIQERMMAESPDSWRQAIFSDPEYAALHEQHENLTNQAVAQLVSTLGSRPFTKLDLYTRHYKDRMKAAQDRKQAESSQGGAQK
jgi:hypothetical protein